MIALRYFQGICPGWVDTPMISDFKEWFTNNNPDYKFLDPKDIADAVLYALGTPPHVNVRELQIAPISQSIPYDLELLIRY